MTLSRELSKFESKARGACQKVISQVTRRRRRSSRKHQESPAFSTKPVNHPAASNHFTQSSITLPESGQPSRIPVNWAVKWDSQQNTNTEELPKPVQPNAKDTVKELESEYYSNDNVHREQNLSGKQEAVEPETGLTRDSGFNSLSQCMTESDPMHVSDEWSEYGWTLRTSGTCTDDGESTWCANVSGNQIKPDQEEENRIHSHLEQESTDLIIRSLEMDEESLSEYEDANEYMDTDVGSGTLNRLPYNQ